MVRLLYFDDVRCGMTHFLRLAFACVLSISVTAQPVYAQHTPDDVPGSAKITGKVVDSEGREVRGARVLAVHLSSSRVFLYSFTG